jgi:hypothetical protein
MCLEGYNSKLNLSGRDESKFDGVGVSFESRMDEI